MKTTCKICWAFSALSILVIGAMIYMFVIRGSITGSDDGRTAIIVTNGERNFVLAEMRDFLESVQAITAGLAEGDMATVTAAAKSVGMVGVKNVSTALMGKLPLEFKTLGMETHKAFDALASEARTSKDTNAILSKLADLTLNCTTCHAGYRLDTDGHD